MNCTFPLLLDQVAVWRTYLGGSRLAQLHGRVAEDGHFPEEWIMSMVRARNVGREMYEDEGLSHLADAPEISLKSVVENDPAALLGAVHAQKYGATTGVLVKLIDAAERLTIQVHPNKQKAQQLFNSAYGKCECWHILDKREVNGESPCIYFGFRPGITRERWKQLFDRQDIAGMLACLHRFDVCAGDTILIEGGVPHAIGAGCFLAEIQEPTDYTIRTERVTPSGFPVADSMCHQELGFDRMFDCFDYNGLSAEETRKKWFVRPCVMAQSGGTVTTLIDSTVTQLFAMEMVSVTECITLSAAETFSGLYVLAGDGRLFANGRSCALNAGQQYFIPPACGMLTLQNSGATPLRVLRCFGPA